MMKIIATPVFQENVCMCVCHTCLLSIEAFFFFLQKEGNALFQERPEHPVQPQSDLPANEQLHWSGWV